MFLQNKLLMSFRLLLLPAAALLAVSCGAGTGGPDPEPKPPVVKIVNIPASGSHFTNSPLINWYGTDADGYIVAYEYAVVTANTLLAASVDTSNAAQLRAYAKANIELPGPTSDCIPACWTIVDVERSDSPTRQQVRLVAGTTPADTVVQFFFVRAIDNDSVSSEIEYSIYSRNNNPPQTEITTTYERDGFFDLPDTNSAYGGISFDWKGTDKIDFPSDTDQPEFDFYYQVFGPYDRSELNYDDTLTGKFTEGFGIDTTNVAKLVLSSRDPVRGGVWVPATSARVFNLWRTAPIADTTREGYFVLKVTARDDASAPDPTPDFRVFRAIYPRFEKRILLYAPRNCRGAAPGEIACEPGLDGVTIHVWSELNDYYRRIFVNAGYTDVDTTRVRPSKIQAAKYKLIVMLGDGNSATFSKDDFSSLTQYMDLGGNVWVWSPNPLMAFSTGTIEQLNSFSPNSVPIRYFRVTGEYRDGWTTRYQNRVFWDSVRSSDTTPPENLDQFVGGLALNGTGFHDFNVDLEKVQTSYNCKRGTSIVKWYEEVVFRGAPHTNYFVRDVLSTPLFLYKSYFGGNIPDNFKRWVKPLHGTVIAVKQDNGQFKSAVFGFSSWSIYEDDAVGIVTEMCDWFLD